MSGVAKSLHSKCDPIQRVGIIGGTHGNELSGVTLVRRWLDDPSSVTRASFRTIVELGNPRAIRRCVRYIDVDLNRCFNLKSLREAVSTKDEPYENVRAQELNNKFGPKGSDDAFDVVIDLHNSASNMGNCFMPETTGDPFLMHMARYLQSNSSETVPVLSNEYSRVWQEGHCAASLGIHGLSLEIGPQSHGTLPHQKYEEMDKMVKLVLDFIELYNRGHQFESDSVEMYQCITETKFPSCSKGYPTATIHPQLQSRDWQALNPGDPMFMSFDGETITYDGEETVYPVFIAEPAYFEHNTAFLKTRKEVVEIPPLRKPL